MASKFKWWTFCCFVNFDFHDLVNSKKAYSSQVDDECQTKLAEALVQTQAKAS